MARLRMIAILILFCNLTSTFGEDGGILISEKLGIPLLKFPFEILKKVEEVAARLSPIKVSIPARTGYNKASELSNFIGYHSNINLEKYRVLLGSGYDVDTSLNILGSMRPPQCKLGPIYCNPLDPYRSITGKCNNLIHQHRGSSFTQLPRFLPAKYHDGVNEPRGPDLPNPRYLSSTLHDDLIAPDPSITNMVPQFGQFLDHDMSLTPEAGGVREQMNAITSYLDASNVYGSTEELAWALRDMKGTLRTEGNEGKFPPNVTEISKVLYRDVSKEFKGRFVGGDFRINEMPALLVMHTLFLREHNRIAHGLNELFPNTDEETLFQTTRRILIAEWQNLVYNEYLPVILGKESMDRYGLTLVGSEYTEYNPDMDASIRNEFATAAFRFGHSLINGIVKLFSDKWKFVSSFMIRDNSFVADQVVQNNGEGYDFILNGLQIQNSQKFDRHATVDVENFLFKLPDKDFGSDLKARNTLRGREHGIPEYPEFREYCGLSMLTTWDDIPEDVMPEAWILMSRIYGSVHDIDLFTGGLSEKPVPGGVSGPTFNCLKALQFQSLKYGDRFFFTHEGQAGSFSPEQLKNIRARNLGDIMCENSGLEMTSVNVFLTPSAKNPAIPCDDTSRAKLDFKLFNPNK